jgi:hypothetical protein
MPHCKVHHPSSRRLCIGGWTTNICACTHFIMKAASCQSINVEQACLSPACCHYLATCLFLLLLEMWQPAGRWTHLHRLPQRDSTSQHTLDRLSWCLSIPVVMSVGHS